MIEEIEVLRKKAMKKKITCYIVIFFLILGLLLILKGDGLHLAFFAFVLSIIIENLICHKDVKAFIDLYKKGIVVETFKTIFTDVDFNLNAGIEYNTIASTKMMYMGDRFHSNDYVKGKYKNINFECSDVRIEKEETDSDGNTTYVTIFRGQWYIFDFNKYFKSNIQVRERFFSNSMSFGLKKVELEDMEFNKKFKVYAKEAIEAFYVLTPGTMEKIKNLEKSVPGKLLLCFVDNKLHIGLHNNKDLFEHSVFKKVDFEKDTAKTRNEMSIITNFIDILSLDNDLFKTN